MTVAEIADQIGQYSVFLLWTALIIRARPALRSHYQRGLWLAILSAATAITLFQPEVVYWMADVTGNVHIGILIRNLFGVLAAGLTLLFIVDSTRGRRLRLAIAFSVLAALLELLTLDLAVGAYLGPAVPPSGGAVTPSTAYWVIVCSVHLVTDLVAVVVCVQYSRRTDDRDLVWSLRLFAAGSVLAVGYWVAFLIHVYVRMPQALPYMSAIINIHGTARALTLLVPTATAAVRFARDAHTVWVLWPMWHDLFTAVPNVALVQPRPTRLREILRPRAPIGLQAHRQTIETYDAILDLQPHVREQAYEEALRYVQRIRIPAPRAPAAALAGALGQARRNKLAGQSAPTSSHHPLPGLDHGDTDLLMAIARSWNTMHNALPGTSPPNKPDRSPAAPTS